MPKRSAQAAGLASTDRSDVSGANGFKRSVAGGTEASRPKLAPSKSQQGDNSAAEEDGDSEQGSFEDLEDDSEEDEFAIDEHGSKDGFEQSDDDQDLLALANGTALDDENDSSDASDSENFDTDDVDSPEPVASTSAAPTMRKQRKPKQLSADELRALAFAELTASPVSSTISTRVTHLLKALTPPVPSGSPLQPLLKDLHAHWIQLAPKQPQSLRSLVATCKKRGLAVPTYEGSSSRFADLKLAFEKPLAQDVRIVGRWAWGGGYKANKEFMVDIAVAMPKSLLQPKDFMAPRFAIKSMHYLLHLASELPEALGPVKRIVTHATGSQALALELRPDTTDNSASSGLCKIRGAVLRIKVVWPPDAFPSAKLNPRHNLARPSFIGEQDQIDPSSLPTTPIRSSGLFMASLAVPTAHLQYHHALTKANPSYPSAVRLLQYWAQKRGFGSSLGITEDWWAWCVASTLTSGSATAEPVAAIVGGEAWAIWRRAVEALANANWTSGIFLNVQDDDAISRDDFKKAFAGQPIFVDPTGKVNLAAGIHMSTLDVLKLDAKATISLMLSSHIADDVKFMRAITRDVVEAERFDNFARVVVPAAAVDAISPDESLDFANKLAYLQMAISDTLRRALSNRVKAFQLMAVPITRDGSVTLNLGLLLDQVQSLRAVDQGPSAEDTVACADWSAFWGPKSELRRFKDGSILETVVWDEHGPDGLGPQRHTVVARIVKYILQHRHGLEDVSVFSGALDSFMVESAEVRKRIYQDDPVATGKGFSMVMTAFDELAKQIKDADDLPLGISAITPVSPSLRYSSIFTPAPRKLKSLDKQPFSTRFIEAHEFDIAFESSGRWPEDLEAVQKIKAAFLTKIAESLEGSRTVVSAQVAFDLEARPIDDNVKIEILTRSGFAFTGRVAYERSMLLHQERVAQLGDAAQAPFEMFKKRFVHLPKHHGAIAQVQQTFTSYSHTVRLVKRWFSSHMLSHHFDEEQIELLCANAFIDGASPFDPPQSGATGFARVMAQLSEWNFKDEPLFVPLYTFSTAIASGRRAAFAPAKRDKGVKAFQLRRLADKNVHHNAWFIATEEDTKSNVWGAKTSAIAAGRARALAAATLTTLNRGVLDGRLVPETLFKSPLSDYAFLIHLDPAANPRHYQALETDRKALQQGAPHFSVLAGTLAGETMEAPVDDVRISWDPVTDFVKDLETLFPSTFVLFHAKEGGCVIGGIWEPSVEGAPRSFQIGLGFPFKPDLKSGHSKTEEKQTNKVVIDKEAVLAQIKRIGQGLVIKTELLR
ncbi:U3 snoRNP protein [Microbotryomycetes sp. JL201]|nr:U3 snoRNP protein [Microbotryomycetes sp. JL201]